MKKLCLAFLLLCAFKTGRAQTCADYVVQINATIQASPPQISLSWPAVPGSTACQVFRKAKNSNNWGAAIASLPGSATGYIDNNVVADSAYEYAVEMPGNPAYGYIYAGIKAPPIHSRGTLLLLVDSTFTDSCSTEISQLIKDISGDGWRILRKDFKRTAGLTTIKTHITTTAAANSDLKALFILGHIAVPYSGNYDQSSLLPPDGHTDHAGAWPADTYYGDLNGTWTDVINNVMGSRAQNKNTPGDGKWDQTQLPSDLELQVGRVDFANMPAFAKTEIQLMKSYLNKDHQYKTEQLAISRKVLIDDNFGKFSGEGFGAAAYRLTPLIGNSNIQNLDFVPTLNTTSYQWAFGCGGGSYTTCSGVGATGDFTTNNVNSIFTITFGSYFGDWDAQNVFLRAMMCSANPALTSCWSGRPHWYFHHMALGENIGYSAITSQNNTITYKNPKNIYAGFVHTALLGDPTLRTEYVKSPTATTLSADAGGAKVTWTASADGSVIGYYLYNSDEEFGTYKKRSGLLTSTSYIDSYGTDGMKYYMVRAVKLQQTPSGSYYNLSLGTTSAPATIDYPYAENTGIETRIGKNGLSVYPNPANDHITISLKAAVHDKATLKLVNLQGQIVFNELISLQPGLNAIPVSINNIPAGVYNAVIVTGSETFASKWLKK